MFGCRPAFRFRAVTAFAGQSTVAKWVRASAFTVSSNVHTGGPGFESECFHINNGNKMQLQDLLVKLIDALNKTRSLLNNTIYWMINTQLHRHKF